MWWLVMVDHRCDAAFATREAKRLLAAKKVGKAEEWLRVAIANTPELTKKFGLRAE